jgi:hypothetical protein
VALDFDLTRPWVRQPFDTDLSWALFQEYLAMNPPRRLGDLARRPGFPMSKSTLENLAWSDGWEVRAARWDSHLDQLRTRTVEQVVQEDARMRAQRQGRQRKKLARLGELAVDRLIKILELNPDFGSGEVPLKDAIRAIGIGVRVERLALGDTTDKIETGPDLSNLSLDDLRKLREIQEKAGIE